MRYSGNMLCEIYISKFLIVIQVFRYLKSVKKMALIFFVKFLSSVV